MTERQTLFAETDLALPELIIQLRLGASEIVAALPEVIRICRQFEADPSLRPVHCDYAVAAVRTLHEPIKLLTELLRERERLPKRISVHRYSLLATLSFAEEESASLILMLAQFRPICRDSSFQVQQRRGAIVRQLDDLIQAGDAIPPRIANLLEHAWAAVPATVALAP